MAPSLLQLDPLVPQLIDLCRHLLLLLHELVVRVHPWLQVCCGRLLCLLLLRLQLGLQRPDLGLEAILSGLVLGLESIDLLLVDFLQPVLKPLYVQLRPVKLVPAILGLVRPVARRMLPAVTLGLILVVLRAAPGCPESQTAGPATAAPATADPTVSATLVPWRVGEKLGTS